ncbi:MAG: CHAT domain-containing protein [Bacteroidales bacterium]|nr:CHAT domain-containing protein [Bacteroidales bacterium]
MRLTIVLILMLSAPARYLYGHSAIGRADSSLSLIYKGSDCFVMGDYIRAEEYFKQALDVRVGLHGENHLLVAHALNNLGVVDMKTWNYDAALVKLKKAEEIYIKNSQPTELAVNYSNIGMLYLSKGEFTVSEYYLNKALDILKSKHDEYSQQSRCEIYLRYAILEAYRKNYKKSIELGNHVIINHTSKIEHSTLHNFYTNISISFLQENLPDSAYKYIQQSLLLVKKSGRLPINYAAESYISMAKYYIYISEKEKALEYLKMTQDIYDSIKIDSSYYYDLYLEYAGLYEKLSEYGNALKYYQHALGFLSGRNLQGTFGTPPAGEIIEPVNGILLLKNKAGLLHKWYLKDKNTKLLEYALEALQVAARLIDNARNGYLTFESKLSIAENETPIYKLGTWCSHQLFKNSNNQKFLETAFFFADKSKSSILEAALREEKAKHFAGIPDSLLVKEQNLKREIAFYTEQVYEEQRRVNADTNKLGIWNNYLFRFTQEQESLNKKLEKDFPDYFRLKYSDNSATIKNIQQLLDRNTTLLEYSISDTLVYIFVISKKHAEVYTAHPDSNFFKHAAGFIDHLRNFSMVEQGKDFFEKYQQLSGHVFDVVFRPLVNCRLNENIIIVPDEILSYMPFEALTFPVNDKKPGSYADMHFLFHDYSFSYSYSSSLLTEIHKMRNRSVFNKLVAFAPEYPLQKNTSGSANALPARYNYRSNLAPLPFAADEAALVSSLTYGRNITGKEATEKRFLEIAPFYDIIHLAMHTIIDDNNPLFSKLVFYSGKKNSDEGLLTTNEIFGLRLKARLTVLSSCSTGEGEYRRGEGVLSLARGFFYAGCPSLVMTLWKVEDESGLTLMRYFYKYLRKGHSKPMALRMAKAEYLKTVPEEKQHPFYWSGYICIGNTAPLYYSRWQYIISVLALFLIYKLLRKLAGRRTRKKSLKDPAV